MCVLQKVLEELGSGMAVQVGPIRPLAVKFNGRCSTAVSINFIRPPAGQIRVMAGGFGNAPQPSPPVGTLGASRSELRKAETARGEAAFSAAAATVALVPRRPSSPESEFSEFSDEEQAAAPGYGSTTRTPWVAADAGDSDSSSHGAATPGWAGACPPSPSHRASPSRTGRVAARESTAVETAAGPSTGGADGLVPSHDAVVQKVWQCGGGGGSSPEAKAAGRAGALQAWAWDPSSEMRSAATAVAASFGCADQLAAAATKARAAADDGGGGLEAGGRRRDAAAGRQNGVISFRPGAEPMLGPERRVWASCGCGGGLGAAGRRCAPTAPAAPAPAERLGLM